MRRLIAAPAAIAIAAFAASSALAKEPIAEDCTFNGIPLHGEVQVVENFADIEVEIVTSFPDLKVKYVDNFADDCGEWELVESFPDFTIEFVDNFGDIEIQVVESWPGLP